MRLAVFLLLLLPASAGLAAPERLLAAPTVRAVAGEPFELVVLDVAGAPLPDELEVRVRRGLETRVLVASALGPQVGERRAYRLTLPPGLVGSLLVDLPGGDAGELLLQVAGRADAVQQLTGAGAIALLEPPPISENESIYFAVGPIDGWSARFQLSFKYRLFDIGSGFGRSRPWLSGLYFGYTQTSLWDLSSPSKVFRDTSYRPSLFWRWQRIDEKTFIDGVRAGVEHESNGREGPQSRSIDIAFVQPEWRFRLGQDRVLEFLPKFYTYLDRDENPDIQGYRGHADWRLRYDAGGEWIASAVARRGTLGKGSVLLELAKRARDLRVGRVGGYWLVQYFSGYGEDIIGYNLKREPQIRFGFAIVP